MAFVASDRLSGFKRPPTPKCLKRPGIRGSGEYRSAVIFTVALFTLPYTVFGDILVPVDPALADGMHTVRTVRLRKRNLLMASRTFGNRPGMPL